MPSSNPTTFDPSHGHSLQTSNKVTGFTEIGFYSPPLIASAGRILRAVVSRQCKGGKWCLYVSGKDGCQMRTPVKGRAVEAAWLATDAAHAAALAEMGKEG